MTKFKLVPWKKGLMVITAFLMTTLSVTSIGAPSAHAAVNNPSDMSGVMFLHRQICVEGYNSTSYPLAAAAQQFNLRSSGVLQLNYRTDCAAAGYSPSQWFRVTVGSGNNGSANCILSSSRNHVTYRNGMNVWDRPPIFSVWPDNTYTDCGAGSSVHMAHLYSEAVGLALGLKLVCGLGWSARVMEHCTTVAWDNVAWASQPEGDRIAEIYQCVYGGCIDD